MKPYTKLLSMTPAAIASRLYRKRHPERVRDSINKYRRANPGKRKSWTYAWRDRNPERYMWITAKKRAKKKNIKFAIESTDIHIPTHCPWLGIKLAKVGSGKRSYGPSIDRMDNSKGYTPDNIEVTSCRANGLKSDATLDELILMGKVAARRKA